ncbi:MAG: hypothetical protein K0S31_1467 [Sphingobacterium multivorum]|jgi:hypothetical protein|nr:hypothetical protein [Sphingobacterium multivorum]
MSNSSTLKFESKSFGYARKLVDQEFKGFLSKSTSASGTIVKKVSRVQPTTNDVKSKGK